MYGQTDFPDSGSCREWDFHYLWAWGLLLEFNNTSTLNGLCDSVFQLCIFVTMGRDTQDYSVSGLFLGFRNAYTDWVCFYSQLKGCVCTY